MVTITPAQWLVLDNLKSNWPYTANLDKTLADAAYLWAVNNEYIKDGKLTDLGSMVLKTAHIESPNSGE